VSAGHQAPRNKLRESFNGFDNRPAKPIRKRSSSLPKSKLPRALAPEYVEFGIFEKLNTADHSTDNPKPDKLNTAPNPTKLEDADGENNSRISAEVRRYCSSTIHPAQPNPRVASLEPKALPLPNDQQRTHPRANSVYSNPSKDHIKKNINSASIGNLIKGLVSGDNIHSEANSKNELTASAFLHSLVKNPAVCSGQGLTYSLDLASLTPDQFFVKDEIGKSKKSLKSGGLGGKNGFSREGEARVSGEKNVRLEGMRNFNENNNIRAVKEQKNEQLY
jgi:hypothetical protein